MVAEIAKNPGDVGVPDSIPLPLRERPGGMLVELANAKVYGAVPPEAVKRTIYGVPTTPFPAESGDTESGEIT